VALQFAPSRGGKEKRMKTRVMFVNAINPMVEVERRYPNLGLGYIISTLREHFGHQRFDFKVVDRNVTREIERFQPHIIGISSVTQNYNLAKRYAQVAKSQKIPVIIGGVHISALPNSLSPDMDIGCIGEAEETVVELFEAFLDRSSFPKERLNKIKGIAFWTNGGLHITESREPIKDLDSLPLPARDIFKIERHSYIFSSRGCPFRCTFCASSRFWGKVRFFSAEYVVREIEELANKYHVKMISFFDDLFVANKSRLKEIVNLMKREGLDRKVKLTCSCTANRIDDEIVMLLKEMNVCSVGMGLESGCERTLKFLKGDNFSVEDNVRAVKTLEKYGIRANASFVIGSPLETKEEVMETYRFIQENLLTLVDVYVLTPFPGTPIWDYAMRRRLVSNDMDWDRLNVNFESNYENAIILSEKLDKDEIIKLYWKFRKQRLYRNLKKIWRSPFVIDVPKIAFRMFVEKLRRRQWKQ
jgi:radical SAM superfamily enzyme YgiQ (UPF0313 family)